MDLGLVIPELQERYQRGAFLQTIEKLQNAEIRAIEPHASFFLDKKDRKILELNQELQARNISILSVHAPFGENKDLSDPGFITRNRAISQHLATMEKMDIIKIPVLTIHPGSRLELESESQIPLREKLFRKSLETLLKQAEKLKIKLAVENMLPMRSGAEIRTIKEIIDEFSSPYLGVCFDTGHANVGKGVLETFNVIKEKIFDFHVHDNDGTKDMHLQPPYGNIDWTEFFALVKSINYQRPLMVESMPWQGREAEWMLKEIRMLKDNKILIEESPRPHYLKCSKCNHFIYGTESKPICYCSSTLA